MGSFMLFCFGVPFIFTLLPLTTSSYGNAGAWCWITTPVEHGGHQGFMSILSKGNIWRLVLFYLPLWTAIFFNTFVYAIVNRTLTRIANTQASDSRPKYVNMIRRLRMYPLILAFW